MLSQDKEQGKSIVIVGRWNHVEHLQWSKKNVARTYQLKEEGTQKVKYDCALSCVHMQANVLCKEQKTRGCCTIKIEKIESTIKISDITTFFLKILF